MEAILFALSKQTKTSVLQKWKYLWFNVIMKSRKLEFMRILINPGITWLIIFFWFSVFVRSISKRCETTPEDCPHFQGKTPRSRHCTEVRFCTVLFMRLDLLD